MFGRERELRQFADLLARSHHDAPPQVVRVIARAGYGKTAFINAALEATDSGWLVFRAGCHAGQQRTSVAVLRRLVTTGLARLGPVQTKYTSGLEADLAAAEVHVSRYEQAVIRMFEGLLLDHPVVIAIDDIQWIDSETAQCLERLAESVSVGKLCLLLGQRSEAAAPFGAGFFATDIPLRALSAQAAQRIVTREYPAASEEVVTVILERAEGSPFDLTTLSSQANADQAVSVNEVLNSVRTVIADRVHAMSRELRDFLQLCSLIREPIELRVVNSLVLEPERLLDLIAEATPHYLIVEGAELRFTHALVAEAIRLTISLELGLHKRILKTFLALEEPTLKGYDRIAHHANACGEREIEYEYLFRLARKAFSMEACDAASHAFERALAIHAPLQPTYVTFYNEYSMALRLTDRYAEARDVLEEALRAGSAADLEGLGVLASALVWTIAMQADYERAKLRYDQLRRMLRGHDLQDLLGVGAMLAMELRDAQWLEEIRVESEADPHASGVAAPAVLLAEAILKASLGNFSEVRLHVDKARVLIGPQRSIQKFTADIAALNIDFLENGCAVSQDHIPRLLRHGYRELPRSTVLHVLEMGMFSDFARGHWDEALAKIEECDVRSIRGDHHRTRVLATAAAIAAFTGTSSPYADLIEFEVRAAVRQEYRHRALQLGFWWAASLAHQKSGAAEALASKLAPWLEMTIYTSTFFFPVSAFLYASRAGDSKVLEHLVRRDMTANSSPWQQANDLLAAGAAKQVLRHESASKTLVEAQKLCRKIGASFLAAYITGLLGSSDKADAHLLESLRIAGAEYGRAGVSGKTKAKATRRDISTPTVREMQVAELIAEGYANRRIAEELVLSERTVEAHIANLFSKLGVSSRTQLARWLIERRTATP